MKRTIIIAGIAGTALIAAGAYAGGNKAGQAQQENIPYSAGQSSSERTAEAQSSQSSPGSQDSETVKKVQSALAAQGYDPGPVDGKIGARTQQALKQAQKDKGLSETGQIDAQTLAALGASESGQPPTSPEPSGG